MCVTSKTCSTAVCVSQLFHNAFDEYFMELKARSCRFMCSVQGVCVSWFGTIKFFAVAVVLTHHTSYGHVRFATHPQSHESCEVVLMCVTSQTLVCNDLFCRCLRDAILSRPINACSILLGLKASSRRFKCSSQSVRVPCRVWYCQVPWCCRGFDMPQVIGTYYLRPIHNQMKAVGWYSCG